LPVLYFITQHINKQGEQNYVLILSAVNKTFLLTK